jgi:hypothetical protein
MNRASILAFFLVSLFALVLPAQTYCTGFCLGGPNRAAISAPASISVSAPFGAVHAFYAIRDNTPPGLPAVAAVSVRSFASAPAFPFPLEPGAGLVLLDVTAPAVIDVSPMSDDVVPGVQWTAAALFVPNDPALVGQSIHSQAFLLLTSGAWQLSNCNVCVLVQ